MQAVILAAGKSQRFYPFSLLSHKSMLKLFGKPLLQHTLEALKSVNIHKVIIVVAPSSTIPKQLEAVKDVEIEYIVQEKAMGMGDALLKAEPYLEETFILLSGYHADVADFAKQMQFSKKEKDEIVLLAKEDVVLERYGVLEVKGNKVLSVVERPDTSAEKGLRVIGMYILNKTFIKTLSSIPLEHYHFEKALDMYAKIGKAVFIKAQSPTITLKHSWDILSLKEYFLSKIKRSVSPNAQIAKNATIEGNVVISDGVKILEGACIKGPCFLGENVLVGNNAIIRGGVIVEKNVVIGATMEVKNSVLMESVTTHTGFIGDSVIGAYSRLAAGFCTANVRFDRKYITAKVRGEEVKTYRTHIGAIVGEHVDTGIQVSTMPGICIGNNVTIGPSTIVMENVEDEALLYTKFQTVIKKKRNE